MFSRKKYGNNKTTLDGIKFDSQAEANYYAKLKILQLHGDVKSFEMQVQFVIASIGKKSRKYIADFVITFKDGHKEVHDVKGVKTPVYQLKKFLMEEKHGIKIVEITK